MRKITFYRIINAILTILALPMLLLSSGDADILDIVSNAYWNTKYRKYVKAYKLYKKQGTFITPLIRQMQALNPSATKSQEEILKKTYSDDALPLMRNRTKEKSDLEAYQYIRKCDTAEKKGIFTLLFQLTVADDGIKNDEWELLQGIMKQAGLNAHWINYFTQRYQPLRTEFDSYSFREKESTSPSSSVSYLKPYYNLLGLKETASPDEVKRAYHQLALQHHPDLPKNAENKVECEKMMARINEAYAKISNRA